MYFGAFDISYYLESIEKLKDRWTHSTSVAFYISRIKKKKTKINHRKWLYYFSKYSPWRSIHFFMHLNQFSKHFFHSDWGISKTCILNALTASTGVEKRWPRNLFLICGNKKKSLGAKSGLPLFFRRLLVNKLLCTIQNRSLNVALMVQLPHVRLFWRSRRPFSSKCIQSTAVYFRAHMHRSMIRHLLRCHRRVLMHHDRIFFLALLSTNRHEPFFDRL